MRCPNCGTLDGRVIDSRDLDDSTTVRRRRECSTCHSRYTTYERVESARLIVVKSNGTREEFDRDKVADGLSKALVRRPVGPLRAALLGRSRVDRARLARRPAVHRSSGRLITTT